MAATKVQKLDLAALHGLPKPTPWPNANARLLGVGAGLPVEPLKRLADFDAASFERFTLEWASEYLAEKVPGVYEVQQRGGAGDKGRDVIVWFDPPGATPRRWHLYQCKHYSSALGSGTATEEIGKVLYYAWRGDYSLPELYWFVTHKGVTSPLQDLLDEPNRLKAFLVTNWEKHCAKAITSKEEITLTDELLAFINSADFSIFRAKQPHDLLAEHRQTRFYLPVFGLPLIDRPKPPTPPSEAAPTEAKYIAQLFEVFSSYIGSKIVDTEGLSPHPNQLAVYDRSRITFYCAEGLKELARDHMADVAFFETLLDEFHDGLYHYHTEPSQSGMSRLTNTIKGAQSLDLGGHVLSPHVRANDREGICHHLANEERVNWCKP